MESLITLLKTDANAANAFGALASAAAAFFALLLSIVSIWITIRTSRLQHVHNALSVRPLAEVTVANYENSLRVKLLNNGTGPMILVAITVSNERSSQPSLIEWMPELPSGRMWNNYSVKFDGRTLAAGAELTLLELTQAESEGDSQFALCRDIVRDALAPLTVDVEYTDLYGERMSPIKKPMSWFARAR